ncbi:hypothetical protein [Intestinibacter bartlettii]|uniref:hypothetical protein n=2 Tax=Intestinibacter bartlettii TaxID=261299 RepID=UPI0006C094FE|nr:hypothetical protein [Intestinibacter bartlettii]CUO67762.1 phage protein [Intestinibacter bartlettii]
MKYTMLGFSQQIAADYGLDLNDLAILRWFVDFKESGNMRSMKIDGDVYYWVFYEKISEELFIIKLQKSAIYKRLKKMCDCDILKKKTVSCGGNYSYFALGENYEELIKSQKYIKTKSPKKNNTSPDENTTSGNDTLDDLDHDYNINAPFESSSNEDSTQNAISENTITKVLDHTSYDYNLGAHYNNLNLHDKNLGPLDINLNPQDENLSVHDLNLSVSDINLNLYDQNLSPHDLCLEQIITPSHSSIKTINHTQEESGEFLLSKLLWHFVKGANPSFSEPDFDLWVRDFGKILHHDHRDFVEVSELISWIFESKSFWTCHVLTPSALRKFYERVLARKNYESNRKKSASKSFFEELESQGFESM